jgi:hypothetical protein
MQEGLRLAEEAVLSSMELPSSIRVVSFLTLMMRYCFGRKSLIFVDQGKRPGRDLYLSR